MYDVLTVAAIIDELNATVLDGRIQKIGLVNQLEVAMEVYARTGAGRWWPVPPPLTPGSVARRSVAIHRSEPDHTIWAATPQVRPGRIPCRCRPAADGADRSFQHRQAPRTP